MSLKRQRAHYVVGAGSIYSVRAFGEKRLSGHLTKKQRQALKSTNDAARLTTASQATRPPVPAREFALRYRGRFFRATTRAERRVRQCTYSIAGTSLGLFIVREVGDAEAEVLLGPVAIRASDSLGRLWTALLKYAAKSEPQQVRRRVIDVQLGAAAALGTNELARILPSMALYLDPSSAASIGLGQQQAIKPTATAVRRPKVAARVNVTPRLGQQNER